MKAWVGRNFGFIPFIRRWHNRRFLPVLQESYHHGQVLLAMVPPGAEREAENMNAKLAVLEDIIGRVAQDAVR